MEILGCLAVCNMTSHVDLTCNLLLLGYTQLTNAAADSGSNSAKVTKPIKMAGYKQGGL